MKEKHAVIFGDGACKGNPGPGGWGLLFVSSQYVIERGDRKPQTTNNEMETQALLEALRLLRSFVDEFQSVQFCWDSQYVLRAASSWIWGWSRSGWKTQSGDPVKNQELWGSVLEELKFLKPRLEIEWTYVPGHSGLEANERVDAIAVSFAEETQPELFDGEFRPDEHEIYLENAGTAIDISRITDSRKNKGGQPQAKSIYLSLVGNQIFRDESWAQCEARIKGVSGAKYKKVKSKAEEEETLKKWGV